jgi:hypothetical protein
LGEVSGLSFGQIDFEVLDPNTLLGETFTQYGQVIQQQRSGRGRFCFNPRRQDTVLKFDFQPQGPEFRWTQPQPDFSGLVFRCLEGPRYTLHKAVLICGVNLCLRRPARAAATYQVFRKTAC